MSAHAVSWAWKTDVEDVEAKILLVKLADQANDDGECFPSLRTICRETKVGRTTAWDRIGKLKTAGLLEVEERTRADGGRSSNLYRLLMDANPPVHLGGRGSSAPADGASSPKRTGILESPIELALSKESAHASLYNALIEACFPAGATLTKRAKQQVALAATNIISGGGIAEMVPAVKRAYLGHTSYSKCALTPMALSSRWSELAPVSMRAPCDKCGIAGGRHAAGCERIAA